MGVDLLVENAVYHNFLRNPQIPFPMLYSRQLKWNEVVIELKQSGRLLLTSLKLSFKLVLFKGEK